MLVVGNSVFESMSKTTRREECFLSNAFTFLLDCFRLEAMPINSAGLKPGVLLCLASYVELPVHSHAKKDLQGHSKRFQTDLSKEVLVVWRTSDPSQETPQQKDMCYIQSPVYLHIFLHGFSTQQGNNNP